MCFQCSFVHILIIVTPLPTSPQSWADLHDPSCARKAQVRSSWITCTIRFVYVCRKNTSVTTAFSAGTDRLLLLHIQVRAWAWRLYKGTASPSVLLYWCVMKNPMLTTWLFYLRKGKEHLSHADAACVVLCWGGRINLLSFNQCWNYRPTQWFFFFFFFVVDEKKIIVSMFSFLLLSKMIWTSSWRSVIFCYPSTEILANICFS